MGRQDILPDWTKGQLAPLAPSPAEVWARKVQSAVVVATGRGLTRADVLALNTESRSLLLALVRRLDGDETIVRVRIGELMAETRLSTRRMVFCLMLLRRAGLVGPAEGIGEGENAVVRVRVLLPEGVRHAIAS